MSTNTAQPATGPDPSPEAAGAPAECARPKPRAWVRLIALLAALATAWHILASFLWIAPHSQNAREIVPGSQDTLSAYMLPFFGQSWSVFAPDPVNGDYGFEVRAGLADGGETEWISATDVELSMIRHTLFPPRAGIQASEVAAGYKDAFDALDEAQRAAVGRDFASETASATGGAEPAADDAEPAAAAGGGALRAALERRVDPANAAGSAADAERLLAEERRATAYATQVAKAVWGDGVERVQFRVSRQNIVPFAQRNDPDAQRPEPVVLRPGWRAPLVEPGQNEENFADVFRSRLERMER